MKVDDQQVELASEGDRSKYWRSRAWLLVSGVILLSLGTVACGQFTIRKPAPVKSTESSATPDLTARKPAEQASTPTQSPSYGEYEGFTYLTQMSRAQSDYNKKATPPRFSSSFNELGLNFQPQSEGFIYRIDSVGLNYVIMSAQAKNPQFKSLTALVLTETTDQSPTVPITSVLICQTEQPSPSPVVFQGAITTAKNLQCPAGSKQI